MKRDGHVFNLVENLMVNLRVDTVEMPSGKCAQACHII